MTRARLVWHWRRWRAVHRYWAADLDYRRRPCYRTVQARERAAWGLRRLDNIRP